MRYHLSWGVSKFSYTGAKLPGRVCLVEYICNGWKFANFDKERFEVLCFCCHYCPTTAAVVVHYNYRDNNSSRNKEPYTVEGTRENKYL